MNFLGFLLCGAVVGLIFSAGFAYILRELGRPNVWIASAAGVVVVIIAVFLPTFEGRTDFLEGLTRTFNQVSVICGAGGASFSGASCFSIPSRKR